MGKGPVSVLLLVAILGGIIAAGCLGGNGSGYEGTGTTSKSSVASSSTAPQSLTSTSPIPPQTSSVTPTTTSTTESPSPTQPGPLELVLPENSTVLYVSGYSGNCPSGKVRVTFVYAPERDVKRVSLRGSFNDWSQWYMRKTANGSWILETCLFPGTYQYKFFVDGEWVKDMSKVDPTADYYVNDGYGGKNAVKVVRGSSIAVEYSPEDPAFLSVADNRTVIRVKVPPGLISSGIVVTSVGNFTLEKQLWWDSGEVWRAEIPFEPFEYFFLLRGNGSWVLLNTTSEEFFHFDGRDRFPQVKWVSNSIGYQIFPDRFFNGNLSNDVLALDHDELLLNEVSPGRSILSNWSDPITPLHCCHQYFGGDIAGIKAKLGYLQSLGVRMIYLNPIFLSGSAHGYDTYDYYKLDPKFGTEEELKNFLDEAHRRGIRVIFDFVPDHTGIGHWAFLDVWENGNSSPYWDWYFVKSWPFKLGNGNAYTGWWGIGSLPKLNTANPEVKEYLIGAVMHWLDFGFDGFRVDVPNDLVNAKEFFRELRSVVKKRYPNAYMVGEVWTLSPEWVKGDRFDSLMNYALGRDVLLPYARGSLSGRQTMALLGKYYSSYGENVVAMGFNLVDSHDTSRVLTDLGGGKLGEKPAPEAVEQLKLLAGVLYTLPGMPITFQGDECGFLGDKDHYDKQRYPLQWDQCNESLVNYYRSLAELRENLPALRSSKIAFYTAKDRVISFFRGHGDGVLVIANSGDETTLELPPGTWREVWPEEGNAVSGDIKIPKMGLLVFLRIP